MTRAKAQRTPRNVKLETQNSKFETISNDQKSESFKQARFGFCNWDLTFFGVVSDFDIRISDFVSLGCWRDNFVEVVLLNT